MVETFSIVFIIHRYLPNYFSDLRKVHTTSTSVPRAGLKACFMQRTKSTIHRECSWLGEKQWTVRESEKRTKRDEIFPKLPNILERPKMLKLDDVRECVYETIFI